ncbi:MAG TPA: hypothetical protein VKB75_05635 [Jatrophihabitans sp.]|nr:hypothetical protein [Jatrophihabitans sp.]
MIGKALVVAAALCFVGVSSAGASAVPYTDPQATGAITLCDVKGNVTTGGDIHTKPFVWRAVGSSAATTPFNGAGRTAALYGYQPIKDVDPTMWEGEFLTAGATYTNPSRPMAAATAYDPSLADLLGDYPPKWNGLLELRMFLGVPGEPTYTAKYNAATIHITGSRWTLLQGGREGCNSGVSNSSENLLPYVRAARTPAPNATTVAAQPSHGKQGISSAAGSRRTASASPDSSPSRVAQSPAAVNRSSSSGTSSPLPWVLLAVAVAAAGGGVAWWRIKRPGSSQ